MFQIYNDPITQYGGQIWDRGRQNIAKLLSEGQKRATQFALGIPIRPHIRGYKTYDDKITYILYLEINR